MNLILIWKHSLSIKVSWNIFNLVFDCLLPNYIFAKKILRLESRCVPIT